MVFHGLLGTVLIDYMKKIWLIRCLNYYTKIALLLYVADVILRTAIYIKILTIVDDVELPGEDQDFGGFLAIYIDNDAGSLTVTCILLTVYATCFISNFYIICLTNSLEKEVKEVIAAKEARSLRGSFAKDKSSG